MSASEAGMALVVGLLFFGYAWMLWARPMLFLKWFWGGQAGSWGVRVVLEDERKFRRMCRFMGALMAASGLFMVTVILLSDALGL